MKETVLLTGAAGFIGSHVAEKLLRSGYRVVGLDNFDDYYDPAIKRENIRGLTGNPAWRIVLGDIRDKKLMEGVFSTNQIDMVIHLAARAGVRPSLELPALYQSINIGGTINVLEQCHQNGVKRVLLASSSSVYGEDTRVPFREDMNVDSPASPYAASKVGAELFCRTYSNLYNLSIGALRFFTVYGPRQRPEMAIHLFTRKIENDEEITIFGDGTSKRDYTFIDDIVDGILRALASRTPGFEVYNLGNSQPIALNYLIQLLEENLGKKAELNLLPMQPGDVPDTYADVTDLVRDVGYKPATSVEQGIANFVDWYRGYFAV